MDIFKLGIERDDFIYGVAAFHTVYLKERSHCSNDLIQTCVISPPLVKLTCPCGHLWSAWPESDHKQTWYRPLCRFSQVCGRLQIDCVQTFPKSVVFSLTLSMVCMTLHRLHPDFKQTCTQTSTDLRRPCTDLRRPCADDAQTRTSISCCRGVSDVCTWSGKGLWKFAVIL